MFHREIETNKYDGGENAMRAWEIRNSYRQIIGHNECDGTVTNTHRQRIGTLEEVWP